MPTWPEIVRSVDAALRLARGDASAVGRLDLSVDGFWKSFAAALVVLPAYILVLLVLFRLAGWPAEPWATAFTEGLGYVIGWLAFPLAAIPLTRLLGLSERYVPLIVANNWSTVIQVAVYTAVVLLGLILPLPMRTTSLLTATLAILVYQWFVIRSALGTTSGIAAGLVVIDLLLSVTVSRVLDGLLLSD
ncbi:MAG: hypothetical protein AB7X49_01080 [Geminicoccaceae bacterium]